MKTTGWKKVARWLAQVLLRGVFWCLDGSQPVWARSREGRETEAGSVIVVDAHAGTFYRFLGEELQRYIPRLTGEWPDIVEASQVGQQARNQVLILVGGPEANSLVSEAANAKQVNFQGLKPEGFVLKSIQAKGHPALVIGGNDEAGTMYGAYDWLERQGIVFQVTGDILPDQTKDLKTEGINVRAETPFRRRGFYFMNDMGNTSVWSLRDYQRFIDQMAKMKFNYLQIFWYSYTPFLSYSYHGEPILIGDVGSVDSGYLLWRYDLGSYKAEDMRVGQDVFARFGKRTMAPDELQGIKDPERTAAAAQELYRNIIRYAKTKKINVWLGTEASTLHPNLARYTRRAKPLPFDYVYGTNACPTDEVTRQINESRVRAMVETYPEAEGYFLFLSEGYPNYDHPEDRELIESMHPKFVGMQELLKQWVPWGWTSVEHATGSMIGEFHIIQNMLDSAKRIAPQSKFGVGSIGNGFVLPTLDGLLPKDVPFTDMESRGVWTKKGVPMEIFGGMGSRERTLIPRDDDDGNNLGMQFNVNLFYKDRVLEGALENGMAGFAAQVYRPRGTEWNSRFLSEAAWNPHLTPQAFYPAYARRIFGDKAAKQITQAFFTLEENEEYLGWRGQRNFWCCGAPIEISIAKKYADQPDPYDGPHFKEWKEFMQTAPKRLEYFTHAVELLQKSLEHFRAAEADVAPRGKYELAHLEGKTEAYILELQTLIWLLRAHLQLDATFKLDPRTDHAAFIKGLRASLGMFRQANQTGWRTASKWAEFADYLSDLEVLRRINVYLITGTELVDDFMQDIDNFHEGRAYLAPIPWERIFSREPNFTGVDSGL
jgi:hypothetical protein